MGHAYAPRVHSPCDSVSHHAALCVPPVSALPARELAWPEWVRPVRTPSLAACAENGLLRLKGARLATTKVDVTALRLVEWAMAKGRTIAMLMPDPYHLLVPLTAGAVHVLRMIELREQLEGGAPRSDLRIGVVTRSYRPRHAYRALGLPYASLVDSVPAAQRLATGEVAVLGSAGRQWGTVFVRRPSELEGIGRLDLVVVELPIYEWDALDRIAAPKIVIGHDPTDVGLLGLVHRAPMFSWSPADLARLSPLAQCDGVGAQVAARLEVAAHGVKLTPVAVRHQAVCEQASQFWNDAGPLQRAAKGSYLAGELAEEAMGLFYDLMHLAVSVEEYERVTGTRIAARLRAMRHEEFQAKGDLGDTYLPVVHLELSDLAKALGPVPPKAAALDALLREELERKRVVLLVARTAELVRVYEAHYRRYVESGRLRVASLSSAGEQKPADVAVLTGIPPAWARFVYGTGLAPEVKILTYATERSLAAIHDGFVEADRVATSADFHRERAAWLGADAVRAKSWNMLSGDAVPVPESAAVIWPEPVVLVDAPAPDLPPDLWSGVGVLAEPQEIDLDLAAIEAAASGGPRPQFASAIRVTFEDSTWVLLDSGSTVTRYDSVTLRAKAGFDVMKIAPGEEIVFLDDDARKDVLTKVIEVAGQVPHLAVAATWANYWRKALLRGKQLFGTYTAFAEELWRAGCERQVQSVRFWVVGDVIGPRDEEDIRRVGEVIKDVVLRDHWQDVAKGVAAFRKAHTELTKRVGTLAIRYGAGAATGGLRRDELIDERTGFTAGDFSDCVEIRRVRSVTPQGVVPVSMLGRLRREAA